jgi:hypothetical protein
MGSEPLRTLHVSEPPPRGVQRMSLRSHICTLGTLSMLTEATTTPLDLLLTGGTVVDPSQGLHAQKDIGIAQGRIAFLEDKIPVARARQVIDCSSLIVTPRLVDLHDHAYDGASHYGIQVASTYLQTGATTVLHPGAAADLDILFDVRHGRGSFSLDAAEQAISQVLACDLTPVAHGVTLLASGSSRAEPPRGQTGQGPRGFGTPVLRRKLHGPTKTFRPPISSAFLSGRVR